MLVTVAKPYFTVFCCVLCFSGAENATKAVLNIGKRVHEGRSGLWSVLFYIDSCLKALQY